MATEEDPRTGNAYSMFVERVKNARISPSRLRVLRLPLPTLLLEKEQGHLWMQAAACHLGVTDAPWAWPHLSQIRLPSVVPIPAHSCSASKLGGNGTEEDGMGMGPACFLPCGDQQVEGLSWGPRGGSGAPEAGSEGQEKGLDAGQSWKPPGKVFPATESMGR